MFGDLLGILIDSEEFVLTGLATHQDLQGKTSGRVWRAPGTAFEVFSSQGLAHCRELAAFPVIK